METPTKLNRFADTAWAVLRLVGLVIVLIFTFRFLRDFGFFKKAIKVKMKDIKVKWEKHKNDPKKDVVKDPLTDKEIDTELDKF